MKITTGILVAILIVVAFAGVYYSNYHKKLNPVAGQPTQQPRADTAHFTVDNKGVITSTNTNTGTYGDAFRATGNDTVNVYLIDIDLTWNDFLRVLNEESLHSTPVRRVYASPSVGKAFSTINLQYGPPDMGIALPKGYYEISPRIHDSLKVWGFPIDKMPNHWWKKRCCSWIKWYDSSFRDKEKLPWPNQLGDISSGSGPQFVGLYVPGLDTLRVDNYVDPMPKSERDALPKPSAIIHADPAVNYGLCFCFDLRNGYIMIGPGKDGCSEIWSQKNWDSLNVIWRRYTDAKKPLRRWIGNCDCPVKERVDSLVQVIKDMKVDEEWRPIWKSPQDMDPGFGPPLIVPVFHLNPNVREASPGDTGQSTPSQPIGPLGDLMPIEKPITGVLTQREYERFLKTDSWKIPVPNPGKKALKKL